MISNSLIFVFINYGGYDPGQIEGLLVNQFELELQYVDGVRSIESKCIQQVAVIQLSFYPGTDMAKAMAQVVSEANRAESAMPPNTLPPRIMQMDAGSVPVGYLVFRSKTRSLGEIADLAQNRIRAIVQARVPGTVATSPFGSNVRSIVVSADPDKLRAYNLAPEDVVRAIDAHFVQNPDGSGRGMWMAHSRFTPDGKGVTVRTDGGLAFEDTATGRESVNITGNLGRPLALSPDGRLVAVSEYKPFDDPFNGYKVQAVVLAEALTGKVVMRLDTGRIYHLDFSPDGRYLATADVPALRSGEVPDNQPVVVIASGHQPRDVGTRGHGMRNAQR